MSPLLHLPSPTPPPPSITTSDAGLRSHANNTICAMQSFFRLPWSTDTGGDKALLDTVVFPQQRPQKPLVNVTSANKAKRKRTTSFESSPRSAPLPKKLKAATHGGAVQPSLQPARGPEMRAVFAPKPTSCQAAMDKSADNTSASDQAGGNMPSQGVSPSLAQPRPSVVSASSEEPLRQQPSTAHIKPASSVHNHEKTADLSTGPIPDEATDMSVDSSLNHVRSIIGAQFDLEILIKHNELRLIEQELAKCQVALEQLRRCELVPYPGSQGVSIQVAGGVGPSIKTRPGYTTPAQPAPYGVTDGPYTRHYSRWLIEDPLFDPQPVHAAANVSTSTSLHDRATRRSGVDFSLHPVSSARASRVGPNKAELSREQPQQWRDPLILKRQKDGQWVKLICTKCNPERSNFQNVQGFLNHCRISHKDSYESHEAAAVACGRPVDVDESYTSAPTTAQQPRKQTTILFAEPSSSKTPTAITPGALEKPVVNSLIRTAKVNPDPRVRKNLVLPRAFNPQGYASGIPTPTQESSDPFVASSQTPYLSALMERNHFFGDLDSAVSISKRKVDTSAYDFSDSDGENTPGSRNRKQKKFGPATQPKPSTASHKAGLSMQTHHPKHPIVADQHPLPSAPLRRPNVTLPSLVHSTIGVRTEIPDSPPALNDTDDMDLSPGTAADSNPGLVSDREDTDDDADEDAMVVDPADHVHAHHHHPSAAPQAGLGSGLGVPAGPNRECRNSLVEINGFAVEIEDSDAEGGREGAKRVRVGGGGSC